MTSGHLYYIICPGPDVILKVGKAIDFHERHPPFDLYGRDWDYCVVSNRHAAEIELLSAINGCGAKMCSHAREEFVMESEEELAGYINMFYNIAEKYSDMSQAFDNDGDGEFILDDSEPETSDDYLSDWAEL